MDRIAIVTGGAKGIGKAIVYELSQKENLKVVLNYNNSEKEANQIKEDLGNKVEIFKADISKRSEVKKLVDYALSKFGKVDILINNAGISQEKMFIDITDEDWNNMLQVNLTSAFYTIQEILPNMIHNKLGCIVNISSTFFFPLLRP